MRSCSSTDNSSFEYVFSYCVHMWKWNWPNIVLGYFSSEIILTWENGGRGDRFGQSLILQLSQGLNPDCNAKELWISKSRATAFKSVSTWGALERLPDLSLELSPISETFGFFSQNSTKSCFWDAISAGEGKTQVSAVHQELAEKDLLWLYHLQPVLQAFTRLSSLG